jgi:hypothetical protein
MYLLNFFEQCYINIDVEHPANKVFKKTRKYCGKFEASHLLKNFTEWLFFSFSFLFFNFFFYIPVTIPLPVHSPNIPHPIPLPLSPRGCATSAHPYPTATPPDLPTPFCHKSLKVRFIFSH